MPGWSLREAYYSYQGHHSGFWNAIHLLCPQGVAEGEIACCEAGGYPYIIMLQLLEKNVSLHLFRANQSPAPCI